MTDLLKEWEEATPIRSEQAPLQKEWEEASPIAPEKPKRSYWNVIGSDVLGLLKGLVPTRESITPLGEALAHSEGREALIAPVREMIAHPETIPTKAWEFVKEHPVSTALGVGLPFVGGQAAVGLARSTLPERIMGSALRMGLDPYTLKTKGMEAAVEKRLYTLGETTAHGVRRNIKGAIKAEELEKETHASTEAVIRSATERNEPVDAVRLVDTGLQLAYEKADVVFPGQGKKIVDAFRNKILQVDESGVPQRTQITPSEANALKRELWNLSKFTGKAPSALSAELQNYMTKGVAHQIEVELEARYPSLKMLNPQDAARIDIRDRIRDLVDKHLKGEDAGGHGAIIVHPHQLGFYASLRSNTWGHPWVKESIAFALDKVRASARGLQTPLYPQIIPGERPSPIDTEIAPQKALPQAAYDMPSSTLAGPLTPSYKQPPRGLIPEQIVRDTRYSPMYNVRPMVGERAAAVENIVSGLAPGEGALRAYTPQIRTRLEEAFNKPAFLRTTEDRLILQEASKVMPLAPTPSPAPAPQLPVVLSEALTPIDRIKFGSKGGVIGRPRSEVPGLRFDGVQKIPGMPDQYVYTEETTGGTFYTLDKSRGNLIKERDRVRAAFEKGGKTESDITKAIEEESVKVNLPQSLGATESHFIKTLKANIAELDSLHKPDEYYKRLFSTATRDPLKKGETWRSRALEMIEQAKRYNRRD